MTFCVFMSNKMLETNTEVAMTSNEVAMTSNEVSHIYLQEAYNENENEKQLLQVNKANPEMISSVAKLSAMENVVITANSISCDSVPSTVCEMDVMDFEKSDTTHSVNHYNKMVMPIDNKQRVVDSLDFSSSNLLSTKANPTSILSSSIKGKYFCVSTEKEVEDLIRVHTQDTFSHFVVAKKTKAYGSTVSSIDITSKFRIHWQSRDLTSTEECAVQIPFQGVPFIYIGEKAYMCHLGRSKMRLKDVPHVNEHMPKKHRSRMTKKQGCSAKIFVKQIAKFPQYKISHNSEYLRTQNSQKLRSALQTCEGKLGHIIEYIGTLPDISDHSNHEIGENTLVKEPIDPIIREKIMELTWIYGDHTLLSSIKNDLEEYVKTELFQDNNPPLKNRRRYYPTDKDIANYIYKFRLFSKLSAQDVIQLNQLVKHLQDNHDERLIHLSIEEDKEVCMNSNIESKNIFAFQTTNQQRLLKRYGRQVIFAEVTSKFQSIPFPLYAIFVATNVDYQLVFLFIIPSRSKSGIKYGLQKALEWNSDWSPKFFVLECCEEFSSVVEEVFPDSFAYISETTCNNAWMAWLNDAMNLKSLGTDENLMDRFVSIAESYTEETLQESAQKLEKSDVWKCSDRLRDWFSSKWLAEAKRWVVGYRHDHFIPTYHLEANLRDDISTLCDLHYSYIKSRKLHDFINHLVESFVPEVYRKYVDGNIADYGRHILLTRSDTIPAFLKNRPATVGSHIIQRLKDASQFTVVEIQAGVFITNDKDDRDKSYPVSFGDISSFPSCVCGDWLKYKLPCKHILSVFQSLSGRGWDMLPLIYTGNPLYNYDFSCFDKEAVTNSQNQNKNLFLITKDVEARNLDCAFVCPSKVNKSLTTPVNVDGDRSDLITSCKTIFQSLSSSLHQVSNVAMLQKVHLDLQIIMNYVNLEQSKIPSSIVPKKMQSTSSEPGKKKIKKETIDVMQDNRAPNLNVQSFNRLLECSPNKMEAWIVDDELNIKLSQRDRNEILANYPISVDIIECAQIILKCQFSDVSGLYDSRKLSEISDEITGLDKTKRILQIHLAESGHWAASGKIGDGIYIFCCAHCDKAKVIKQYFKLTFQGCVNENIIFIERLEDEKSAFQCGMYAIAYCVSMAIGIDPRNIIFIEHEMRSHLVEYLEDMCFSMFPFNLA